MSSGWSDSDLVATLKLLYQISSALRDSGGASSDFQEAISFFQTLSRTLEHLNLLHSKPLDPEIAKIFREQCDLIRVPLVAFLEDVGGKFGPSLGVKSGRNKIFTAPQMIQWALSTSKKAKRLQDRIAVPMVSMGVMLGQQILLTTMLMPQNVLDQVAHTIDTRIVPETALVHRKIEALSEAQISSVDTITRSVQEIARTTAEAIGRKRLEDLQATSKLESRLEQLFISQEIFSNTTANLCTKLENIPIQQPTATDMVIQSSQRANTEQSNLLHRHPFGDRLQSSSLHEKLGRVSSSLGAIENSLEYLSTAGVKLDADISKSEVKRAAQNIVGSIWMLLSSLQLLICELVTLLAPYLIAFYRTQVHGLLLYGDQFLFEDGIGRIKRPPCAQFQHWNIFYDFLIDSFRDTPGLSRVLTQQFRVMNGYNDYPITQEAWRAVIQPRAKITMAMVVLDSKVVRHGSCVDPSCSGRVPFTSAKPSCICPGCGKHIYLLKERKSSTVTENRDTVVLKVGPGLELKTEESKIQIFLTAPDREIAAFKRVFSLDAFIEQATAKKGDSGRWKRTENATTNEYFVPKDGIDREVITADICRYLGYDALVRPGKYENPQIEKFQEGYIITAYRNLTTAMISDLKADTARWEAERRAWPSGTGPKNSFIVPPKLTTQYRGTLDPLKPVLEAQTITTSLEEI